MGWAKLETSPPWVGFSRRWKRRVPWASRPKVLCFFVCAGTRIHPFEARHGMSLQIQKSAWLGEVGNFASLGGIFATLEASRPKSSRPMVVVFLCMRGDAHTPLKACHGTSLQFLKIGVVGRSWKLRFLVFVALVFATQDASRPMGVASLGGALTVFINIE